MNKIKSDNVEQVQSNDQHVIKYEIDDGQDYYEEEVKDNEESKEEDSDRSDQRDIDLGL